MKKNFAIWLIILSFSVLVSCQTTTTTTTPGIGSETSDSDYKADDENHKKKAADLNMRLGVAYFQKGDYETALEKLQKSLQQDPNMATTHNAIALLYQTLGEDKLADKHFKQALRIDSKYSEVQNNYGVFLCDQGQYKEAEQHFLKAIKNPLYRSRAFALENAGMCVNKIPDPILAEKYFRQALQLNPNLAKSLLHMADLSYQNIDYLKARAYIQRYHAVAPWGPKALLLAIKIENKLGDKNAVSSYILLMENEFPDSDEAAQVRSGNY